MSEGRWTAAARFGAYLGGWCVWIEQGKWASHVSYSNDVMLVDEKTNNPVEYMGGKPVAELPDTAPY